MIKEEIIPIIKEGIRIMTQVNEGLEIEVIGEINYTFEITKHYPIGQLGVSTVFRMWGMEEKVFLSYQLCENMIMSMSKHLIAEEMVMMTFREQMKLIIKNQNKEDE
jgi:hypothetical protein